MFVKNCVKDKILVNNSIPKCLQMPIGVELENIIVRLGEITNNANNQQNNKNNKSNNEKKINENSKGGSKFSNSLKYPNNTILKKPNQLNPLNIISKNIQNNNINNKIEFISNNFY